MSRLYFRIYLAVLASLVVLALLAGLSWRFVAPFESFGPRPEFFSAAAERLLPAAAAAPSEQREALARWRRLSGFDLALFGSDGVLIADASDQSLWDDAPRDGRFRPGRRPPHFWSHVVELSDGRWLVVARPAAERGPWRRFGWLFALAAITLAVGIGAYPLVRRLTRRLEALQSGVEALGAGNLSTRVKVEGRDEVAQLAQTFNRSADRIEGLVKAQKSLLANASHELRSPLARLRLGVEALSSSEGLERREELSRNIRELDQLIDEILLASRLDGHSADLAAFEPVDLVALLAEECARAGAELKVPAGTLPVVAADPRLLRRLVRNLLDNAGHYAGSADAEVAVQVSDQWHATFDVCDRGPGVPEVERSRIFEPFYRLPGARERDGGVGLGLALVRQIAERHGGTASCLGRDGGGSIFRVTLPVSHPDSAA